MATTITAGRELEGRLKDILAGCNDCGACVKGCAFLKRHGTPGDIARACVPTTSTALAKGFECSLCGLCSAICPKELDLEGFFLELRRAAVERGEGNYPQHAPLLNYERLGTSRRFTLYRLPEGCRSVFFPGCSLSGTRPAGVQRVFDELKKNDPAVGIVFDCCLKPSHSLGRAEYVDTRFAEMNRWLVELGVREVLVACPNCQVMFQKLGSGLSVRTVWEALAESDLQPRPASATVTVHDPCVIRSSAPVHQAVRTLLARQGVTVEEMRHSGRRTLCCGQGGAVNLLDPKLAASWGGLRKLEAGGRRIVTYCAGCTQALGSHTPTSHLVDLIFAPERALAGKRLGAKAPFTYLNRLRLKRSFLAKDGFAVTRERDAAAPGAVERKKRRKPLVLAAALIAVVAAVQLSGAGQYLQQDQLRAVIGSYGALAPAAYVLLYALAPVLFLPGLPITIAGGVLFGPVWGVVYAISGATIGASLAFLVARYVARDWVAAKLTGPRWQRLDREVERHGWKVVAFTRLVPAFPFNLLNYAFGLTKVPFLHYLVVSFVCMLPACIAFIVFSSSLLGLIGGKVSPNTLLGGLLIAAVSLAPVLYRRVKARREPEPVAD